MADYTHRFVGSHADHVTVGDKVVPVAPGDFLTLSDADLRHEDNANVPLLNVTTKLAPSAPTNNEKGGE